MRAYVVLVVGLWSGVAAAGGLDKPWFSAAPQELLDAAKPFRTSDSAAVVLRDEEVLTIDDAGRATTKWRVVFVINTQSAVDAWGTLELPWSPFYQERPVLRARVISPAGQVSELDPALVTDTPSVSESPSVFSDTRKLEAPLPRLVVGAVVEEEFTLKDREPLLPAGTVQFDLIGRGHVPVASTLLSVDAPAARKVKVLARGFAKPPVPRHAIRNGRETWQYDFGRTEPLGDGESGVPGDVVQMPYIGIATAQSWAAVAKDYRRVVEKRISDGPFALPAGLDGGTKREVAAKILAWLHAHVRYTGIELSDAAIVPWSPAEVVKRGFGDCKDKATLLVALLRAAGIEADLVLLDTGPGLDVDRELSGMGVFDHAIVRARIDGADVWIDATEDGLPVGQLPARDQNRFALIVSDQTTDLVRTPAAAPSDNLVREVRTYHLSENGAATVTEVSTETGAYVDSLRSYLRETRPDEIKKQFTSYAERQYHGKYVSYTTASDPTDISRALGMTFEIEDVQRGYTGRSQIDVYLSPAHALGKVPDWLKDASEEAELATRKRDYAWFLPHVYEIENHLVLPEGYTVPHLVEREQRALGAATLTTTRAVGNGEIVITYRFDTAKPRLTAAELVATAKALRLLDTADGEHVVIARTSAMLAKAGKVKDAVAEAQRLIALHPKEAVHHGHLAMIYRGVGMGMAARREARRGVELEPTSSDAHAVLAFELSQDTLGRDPAVDADRKGAIAAYRKALTLDPKHLGALTDLASLLVHDEAGALNPDRRDMLEAASLLRRANELEQSKTRDQQIAMQLLFAGELTEAESAVRALPESDYRTAMLVMITALAHGSKDALAEVQAIPSEATRKVVLSNAVRDLASMRRYDLAHELFGELRSSSSDPMLALLGDHMKIVDHGKLDPADPTTPGRLLIARLFGIAPKALQPWDSDVLAGVEAGFDKASRGSKTKAIKALRNLPRGELEDLIYALYEFHADGDAKRGWRVEFSARGMKGALYVTLDRGKARLIGVADAPAGVGKLMLALVARRDLDTARSWLARVLGDMPKSAPLAPLAKAFHDPLGATKEQLEVAAAIFVAEQQPSVALPILKRCAPDDPVIKELCRKHTLDATYAARAWTEFGETARKLAETDPNNDEYAIARATAASRLGQHQEAAAIVDGLLAKSPDDVPLLYLRTQFAFFAGGWTAAQPWVDKLAAQTRDDAVISNNLAWARLYHDATPDKARELAERAEKIKTDAELSNTLAAIEVESGNLGTAWNHERTSIAERGAQLDDGDWYVIGRIAESLALVEDARAAYARVDKPKHLPSFEPSSFELAQKRLAAMGKK